MVYRQGNEIGGGGAIWRYLLASWLSVPRGTESHPLCGWMATMLCNETPPLQDGDCSGRRPREEGEHDGTEGQQPCAHQVDVQVPHRVLPKAWKKAHLQPMSRGPWDDPQAAMPMEGHRDDRGNLMPDHVHMLAGIPPRIGVPGFMGCLKGKSALPMSGKACEPQVQVREQEVLGRGPLRARRRHERGHDRVAHQGAGSCGLALGKLSVKEHEDPLSRK